MYLYNSTRRLTTEKCFRVLFSSTFSVGNANPIFPTNFCRYTRGSQMHWLNQRQRAHNISTMVKPFDLTPLVYSYIIHISCHFFHFFSCFNRVFCKSHETCTHLLDADCTNVHGDFRFLIWTSFSAGLHLQTAGNWRVEAPPEIIASEFRKHPNQAVAHKGLDCNTPSVPKFIQIHVTYFEMEGVLLCRKLTESTQTAAKLTNHYAIVLT